MKLRQHTRIQAPAESVWPYLVDPVIQAAWNPKIISIDRATDGPVRVGETYEMIFRMSRKEHLSRIEVVELVPNELLGFEHRFEDRGKQRRLGETYGLTPSRGGVKLTHTIDVSDLGIPLPLRILIWLITRFGKDTEQPYLERLREMIESDLSQST